MLRSVDQLREEGEKESESESESEELSEHETIFG